MFIPEQFLDFLVKAKTETYASVGDDFSEKPLLDGSIQLEYKQGQFFYRDIYFGTNFFSGLETVYFKGNSIWNMSYSGGVLKDYTEAEAKEIYSVLQKALKLVTTDAPFRGPQKFSIQDYTYLNQSEGTYGRFNGTETIFHYGDPVYNLRYGGGFHNITLIAVCT